MKFNNQFFKKYSALFVACSLLLITTLTVFMPVNGQTGISRLFDIAGNHQLALASDIAIRGKLNDKNYLIMDKFNKINSNDKQTCIDLLSDPNLNSFLFPFESNQGISAKNNFFITANDGELNSYMKNNIGAGGTIDTNLVTSTNLDIAGSVNADALIDLYIKDNKNLTSKQKTDLQNIKSGNIDIKFQTNNIFDHINNYYNAKEVLLKNNSYNFNITDLKDKWYFQNVYNSNNVTNPQEYAREQDRLRRELLATPLNQIVSDPVIAKAGEMLCMNLDSIKVGKIQEEEFNYGQVKKQVRKIEVKFKSDAVGNTILKYPELVKVLNDDEKFLTFLKDWSKKFQEIEAKYKRDYKITPFEAKKLTPEQLNEIEKDAKSQKESYDKSLEVQIQPIQIFLDTQTLDFYGQKSSLSLKLQPSNDWLKDKVSENLYNKLRSGFSLNSETWDYKNVTELVKAPENSIDISSVRDWKSESPQWKNFIEGNQNKNLCTKPNLLTIYLCNINRSSDSTNYDNSTNNNTNSSTNSSKPSDKKPVPVKKDNKSTIPVNNVSNTSTPSVAPKVTTGGKVTGGIDKFEDGLLYFWVCDPDGNEGYKKNPPDIDLYRNDRSKEYKSGTNIVNADSKYISPNSPCGADGSYTSNLDKYARGLIQDQNGTPRFQNFKQMQQDRHWNVSKFVLSAIDFDQNDSKANQTVRFETDSIALAELRIQ
jgi:hypothetical protein